MLSDALYFLPLSVGNDGTSVSQFYAEVSGYTCYYESEFVGVAGKPNQVEILFRDTLEKEYNSLYFFSSVKSLFLQMAKFSPYTIEDQQNGYYLFTSARNSEVWFYVAQ